ncbi:MAG TPA: PLP-dependent aminotransferase family protein [Thermoanaerobaculia bacterium]|nr:PLP-dependent aminotransferase family protein [Thermoanaerobaculia bacterium]
MKRARGYTLAALSLDPASPTPLNRQLYEAIRGAILTKQLHAGSRLPSTRSLAADLQVSRNTVLLAFEQLLGEGYLESRTGSGTFVADTVPDEVLRTGARKPAAAATPVRRTTTRRARSLPAPITTTSDKRRAFEPALPALDLFPIQLWTRLIAKQWSRNGPALLDSLAYGDAAGHLRLRTAIAQYVGAARGVACEAEQVIITNGLQHGLEMICRVLLEPNESVWFEDPGYPAARAAFIAAGAQVALVPVDAEGLDVAAGVAKCAAPRLIYLTPSHQFPLGVTMSVPRRLQLLDAARRSDAWILEDDYDGDYRHRTGPVPAVHGLDTDGRVIYVGTFSKSLFPALRLGYIIVPPAVVETFMRARALAGRTLPAIDQLVVADFIELGHFERHIRRMRAAYRERQEALIDSAARHLAGLATVSPTDAGMHSLAWLEQIDDIAASRAAAEENLEAAPLSAFCGEVTLPDALVLGYGAVTPRQIRVATEALSRALERARKRGSRAGRG